MSKVHKNRIMPFLFLLFFVFVSCEVSDHTDIKQAASSLNKQVWPPPDPENKPIVPAVNLLAKNYYIVLDGSGSMSGSECSDNESKMDVAKEALAKFVTTVPEDANLGMLAFDGKGVLERMPLGMNNRDEFLRVVNAVSASDGTPLYSAIKLGYEKLTEKARRQFGYGEYHLVVVTDGEANLGEDPTSIIEKIVTASPVVISTIGFCIGTRHSLNQPGRTIYKAANNPAALKQGLQEILAETPEYVSMFKDSGINVVD